MFDAVAMIPAPDPEMKGKVLDCVQVGYKLHDKVLRHTKGRCRRIIIKTEQVQNG